MAETDSNRPDPAAVEKAIEEQQHAERLAQEEELRAQRNIDERIAEALSRAGDSDAGPA